MRKKLFLILCISDHINTHFYTQKHVKNLAYLWYLENTREEIKIYHHQVTGALDNVGTWYSKKRRKRR